MNNFVSTNYHNMPVKFVFLILPNVHLMDLAGPDQVIQESIGCGADFSIEYYSIGHDVISSAGLPIGKLRDYSKIKIDEGDFLIIPGSETAYFLSDEFRGNTGLFNWINKIHSTGTNICSICTGAFVLAISGLLDGVTCTTHFRKTRQLQELFPLVKVNENILFTEHNRIFTSAGIASGIDMTLHIVEKLKGSYFAHLVARELVVYNRRKGSHNQQSDLLAYRNHIHAGIHNAQDWLHQNLDKKSNLGDLAEIANMSSRNFTRVFRKETGITVNDYITMLRKEKIRELLKKPDMSRVQIARRCGLRSERQLSRIINNT